MKNSTLIALHEANELSIRLEENWNSKHFTDPIYYAKREIRRQKIDSRLGYTLLGIAMMAMMSTFVIRISHEWKAENLCVFFLILCVMPFGASVILIAFSQNDSQSDFGTQLEQLREVLGLTYGEMSVWKLNDLRDQAENILYGQANYTKRLQGPNGENSLSDDAKAARAKYEELHKVLFAFGLCEEKWDKYWETPGQEKEKGEIAGGTPYTVTN